MLQAGKRLSMQRKSLVSFLERNENCGSDLVKTMLSSQACKQNIQDKRVSEDEKLPSP